MTRRRGRQAAEWVGGIFTMPSYITGEGEPYRPEALFWMSVGGGILGTKVGKPGTLLETAGDSLQEAIERPMVGVARAPARLRVASPELADVLRAEHPSIDVACAPTPEIDAMVEAMAEDLLAEGGPPSYVSDLIDPDAVASFFEAAAALHRAAPWDVVQTDQDVFAFTVEGFEVRDAALAVIGQSGESLGLLTFADIEAFEAFLEASHALQAGHAPDCSHCSQPPALPPHRALTFERSSQVPAALRGEIAEHGWTLADPDAIPVLAVVDEGLVTRPLTTKDFTLAEALARALREVVEEKDAIQAAHHGGEPLSRTLTVPTQAGETRVVLTAPHPESLRARTTRDLLDALATLVENADEEEGFDFDAQRRIEDELAHRYLSAPEASGLAAPLEWRMVTDFAASHFGATIPALDPEDLQEIVFEIVPRKVMTEPSTARGIIEANRAFFRFLEREGGIEAAPYLRVLEGDGDAVAELEAALSDPRHFGMGKSLFMEGGKDAGFDMATKEGIEGWLQGVKSGEFPLSLRESSPGRPSPRPKKKSARAKQKSKRKAARKARKRNR